MNWINEAFMPLPLASFFSQGLFPLQASTLQAASLAGAAQDRELATELRQGAVLYRIQDVSGWKMPRLLTLWSLPAAHGPAADAMREVGRWSDWMPRFSTSDKIPDPRHAGYLQEARMKAAGLKIHYRVRVQERPLELGLQLYWGLDQTGFRKDRFALGLAINDGSCAFYPIDENETLAVYCIHTQVAPLMPGTAGKITKTTIAEFPQFPSSLNRRVSGAKRSYEMRPA